MSHEIYNIKKVWIGWNKKYIIQPTFSLFVINLHSPHHILDLHLLFLAEDALANNVCLFVISIVH